MLNLALEWARCRPWLEAALDHSSGGYTLDDVHRMVEAGEAHFWPLREAALVTIIGQYPRHRVCRIWLAGGSLAEMRRPSVEAALLQYARQNDCPVIEIIGRPGWERAMPEFRRAAVVLVRRI